MTFVSLEVVVETIGYGFARGLANTMSLSYDISPFPHVCLEEALNRGRGNVGGLQTAQPLAGMSKPFSFFFQGLVFTSDIQLVLLIKLLFTNYIFVDTINNLACAIRATRV